MEEVFDEEIEKKERKKQSDQKYYQKNKDKIAKKNREKYLENPQEKRDYAHMMYCKRREQLGITPGRVGRPRKYPDIEKISQKDIINENIQSDEKPHNPTE